MPDLVFFYSKDDLCVAREALDRGFSLLLNKDYEPGEDLILLSPASDPDVYPFRNFYVLPDDRFISEISVSYGTKVATGKDFYHIKDRIGAAAIALTLNRKPSEGEVGVGSSEFHVRTYPSDSEPLEPRPPVFQRISKSPLVHPAIRSAGLEQIISEKGLCLSPGNGALATRFFALAMAIARA